MTFDKSNFNESTLKTKTLSERLETFEDCVDSGLLQNMKTTLVERNFFSAPAALKHHGNFPGGLFYHSLVVAKLLDEYSTKCELEWERKESPLIVGILHDMCKTDDYVLKNGEYIWNQNQKYFGHGLKSVEIISEFFELTEQEKKCIRFHMGAFVDKSQWPEYSGAARTEPNILWTHLADMYASQILGI